MIFAFDVVDVTRAYGNPHARFGTDYTTRKISLRSGYSSARGFTVGVQYGFFDIAIGARAPLSISQTLRF